MKLEEYALFAEIVGGVAIVLSLIFVGVQIRGNTQVARAVAYERNIDSINQWRLELISDRELVSLLGAFVGTLAENATAEEVEQLRLNLMLNVLFGIYEKSYYATKYGVMAPEEWNRFDRQACLNRSRAMEVGLWENMETLLTREFANLLVSECGR